MEYEQFILSKLLIAKIKSVVDELSATAYTWRNYDSGKI